MKPSGLRNKLAPFYQPLRLINKILDLPSCSKYRLRVLLFHDIPPQYKSEFKNLLTTLSETWSFISPSRFHSVLDGSDCLKADSLLLTFDDGLLSNYEVAKEILNPLQISAIFFVVSEFVSLKTQAQAHSFYCKFISPDCELDSVASHISNMKWHHLQSLVEDGHVIGSHTATHIRMSTSSEESILREMLTSKDLIARRLNTKVVDLAYPFGSLSSFSSAALAIASQHFEYIHTGIRGFNARHSSPYAIYRDSISPSDSIQTTAFILEGGLDLYYRRRANRYMSWVHQLDSIVNRDHPDHQFFRC